MRDGAWARSPDWCYWKRPLVELDGLTLGIVGYGSIGRQVAALARAFGMNIVATSRSATARTEDGVTFLPFEQLLATSDIVSLHCPLTEGTRGLINSASLARMKPSALLINTSRGPLFVEAELASALQRGQIASAALDVLSALALLGTLGLPFLRLNDWKLSDNAYSRRHRRPCTLAPRLATGRRNHRAFPDRYADARLGRLRALVVVPPL